MRPLFSFLLLLSCGLVTAHCGSSSSPRKEKKPELALTKKPTGTKKVVADHFYIAPEIPLDQQRSLADDIGIIQAFNASGTSTENAEMIKTLGVPAVDGPNLYKWLKDRLQFFMGEKLSYYNFAIVYPRESSYGNFKLADESEEDARLTGAVNVGAGLYNFGRTLSQSEGREQYLRMEIDGLWRDVTTPRIGIMQVGPALFKMQVNPQRPAAFANSAFRIQIMFHEARHSDGNEANDSLSFTHVMCPSTPPVPKELQGKAACDVSSNGAYMVGHVILKSYFRNCGDKCSATEAEVLKALYLDAYSRILPAQKRFDPAPEKGFEAADLASFERINIQ